MAAQLTQRLRLPRTGLPEATEAISALLQLQADGAQSCQELDPVNLFISTLVRLHGPLMTHHLQLLLFVQVWLPEEGCCGVPTSV